VRDSKLVDYLLEDMKTSLFWTFRQSIRKSKGTVREKGIHWIVSILMISNPIALMTFGMTGYISFFLTTDDQQNNYFQTQNGSWFLLIGTFR
jgi:hypothetical protein